VKESEVEKIFKKCMLPAVWHVVLGGRRVISIDPKHTEGGVERERWNGTRDG
jgi:hypothetical protein